jgi:O-antigen ligase
MSRSVTHFLLGITLVLLPVIGLGTIYLLTGNDTGAGFQPSYLTMALAFSITLLIKLRQYPQLASIIQALKSAVPVSYLRIFGGTIVVVLISALGTKIAPGTQESSLVWGRFFRQFIQLLIMACFAIYFTVYLKFTGGNSKVNSLMRWQFFARILVIGGLVQVAYGLLQEIHFYHPLVFFPELDRIFTSNPSILSGSETLYLNNMFQNVPRLRGMACEPLYLGNYLLLVWPFVFLTGWSRVWRWLSVSLLLGLLLLTWSRGAWLGFFFQVAIFLFFHLRSSRTPRLHVSGKSIMIFGGAVCAALAIIALFGGVGVFAFPFERMQQAFSTQDWSNLTRIYSMQAAWRAFLLSPVFGVGWGQFAWHFPVLVDPMGLQSQFTWPVVNNFPLQILSETGGLGFCVFLVSAGLLIKRGMVACWQDTALSIPVLSLVAASGVWLQLMTFSQYNLPHIWVALGALAAAGTYPSSSNETCRKDTS